MAVEHRLRKLGAVEAWIGVRVGIDPTKLAATASGPRYTSYEHAELGRIMIDVACLGTKYALLSDAGLKSAHFTAFRQGYEGKGKKPLWGRRRTYYARGVEARAKWADSVIEVRD